MEAPLHPTEDWNVLSVDYKMFIKGKLYSAQFILWQLLLAYYFDTFTQSWVK